MGVPQLYLALASVPAKSGFAFASMDARRSWICTILSSLQSVIAVSMVPDENLAPANQMDFRYESPFCAASCHGWQIKRRRSKGPAHEPNRHLLSIHIRCARPRAQSQRKIRSQCPPDY